MIFFTNESLIHAPTLLVIQNNVLGCLFLGLIGHTEHRTYTGTTSEENKTIAHVVGKSKSPRPTTISVNLMRN
jgi:hypothetical protein